MKIFVNNAINDGIESYIAKSNNESYSLAHIFELRIIEFLIHLYGKINILNPYQINSDTSFKNNLMVYGATTEDVNKLFTLLNEYGLWLQSNSRDKNNLVKEIFEVLSVLVLLKNKSDGISEEEMKYYEDFFSLKDAKINQIVEMSAASREDVINVWPKRLAESENEPVEESILLNEEEYKKYGLSIQEVESLPEDKIKALNEEIKNRNENDNSGGSDKEKPLQLVLTSGNGFVDALVLFSIMCTEIMIGIVVTIIIARF